jgi:hypothetical protein
MLVFGMAFTLTWLVLSSKAFISLNAVAHGLQLLMGQWSAREGTF